MKNFLIFLSAFILSNSLVFADTNIGTSTTLTAGSATLSAAALAKSKTDFQKTCVNVSDTDLTCGGAEAQSTLLIATSAAEAAALATISNNSGVNAGATIVDLAEPEATCRTMIKCDTSSKTANSTCAETCQGNCQNSTFCESLAEADCVLATVAHSICVQSEKQTCIGLCKEACTSDQTVDDGVRNPNSNGGSTSTVYVPGQDYSTCILKTKPKAQTLQSKCRNLCTSIVHGAASITTQTLGTVKSLADTKKTIQGDGSGNGGDNTPPPPTTTTPPPDPTIPPTPTPYPDGGGPTTQQDCSGKTGTALSQCSCSNLGKTWSSKGCVDSSSNNNLTLTGNSGLPDSGNSSTNGGPSGTGPSGTGLDTGANNSGLSDNDKKAGSQGGSGTGSTTGSSLNGNYSANNTNPDELNPDSDLTNSGDKFPEIAGKDVDLFAKISTTYTGLYNDKKLGFFASKSEEKSDKPIAKKKRVTRK